MTTVQERPRLDTPPPPRRGVRLGLILAVIVALIAGGVWLLIGSDETDPEPAPAPPEQTTAERNAELQAADVTAASGVLVVYYEYVDRIFAAWDMDAAPLNEVATQGAIDNARATLNNIAVEDPTYTGFNAIQVSPEPVVWTPASPRTVTLEVCMDVSESSFTSGGEGPDIRFLPDGSELIPRYLVTNDLVLIRGSWMVSGGDVIGTPC
jgi:hypothetical protein